jgi:hypothetical protein
MPYITKWERDGLDKLILDLSDAIDTYSAGLLNYVITSLCIREIGDGTYNEYNKIIGVLECVKLEFYRRAVSKYEDEKCCENGEVYE